MAAITFPASPALNDIHSVGTRSWKYNGTAWKLVPKTTDAILEGSNNLYYTDARVAAAPAVTALETRAGNIESAASTLAGRVTTSEGNITTLTSGLATEKGRVDAILSASDADKDSFAEIVQLINSVNTDSSDAFAGYVTSNNAAVQAIDERTFQLESYKNDVAIPLNENFNALVATVGEIEGNVNWVNDRAIAAEGVIEGRVTTLESEMDAVESRASDIENSVTAVENSVTAVENSVTAVEGRVSTLESEMDAVEGITAEVTQARGAETNLNDRFVAVEGRASTLESEMDAVEGRASDIEAAASALQTEVTNINSAFLDFTGTVQNDATILQNRVTAAESEIADLQTGKQIKNVLAATAPSHVEGLIWIDTTDMSSYVSYAGAWIEMDRI